MFKRSKKDVDNYSKGVGVLKFENFHLLVTPF